MDRKHYANKSDQEVFWRAHGLLLHLFPQLSDFAPCASAFWDFAHRLLGDTLQLIKRCFLKSGYEVQWTIWAPGFTLGFLLCGEMEIYRRKTPVQLGLE
jgi:hypothetical protein